MDKNEDVWKWVAFGAFENYSVYKLIKVYVLIFKAGAGCKQSQVLQLIICEGVASMYLPKSYFNYPQKHFDEQDWLQFFYNLNSSKKRKRHLFVEQVKNRILACLRLNIQQKKLHQHPICFSSSSPSSSTVFLAVLGKMPITLPVEHSTV